jgi:uncharacterized protein (TIGR02246 family)
MSSAVPVEAQVPESTEPQQASSTLSIVDDESIRSVVMGFERAWNTHDMELLATLFREDSEFINVVGMHWRGRDAVVKAHAIFHEIMFKDCRLKTDDIALRPLGADCALAVVTYTQDAFTTPGGQVMPETQTKLSYVFAKSAGEWKIAHGHNVRIDAEAAQHDPVNNSRE